MEPMHLGSPSGSPPTPNMSSPFLPAYLMGEAVPASVSKVKPSSPTKQPKHVSFGVTSASSPSKFILSPEARLYRSPPATVEKTGGPPIRCLYDALDDSFASPASTAVKTPERSYHEVNACLLASAANPDKSQPSMSAEDNWVTVFGFPPSSTQFIASLFGSCGLIVDKRIPPKGNWMHLRFQSAHEANKALSHNGKIFSGSIMIGAIPCHDPEILKESSQMKENILETSYSLRNTSGVSSPPPRQNVLNQSNASNFAYLGSPVRIGNARPLSQTYRPGQSEENLSQSGTPQRSTSMVTKAMEYVFGW